MRASRYPGPHQGGFTLLELMIVVVILGIVASIGVPNYVGALHTARVGKARHELRSISSAVDAFRARNDGNLPLSLFQVGFGGRRDPWGLPYCYLNYADGTGDGLDWALSAGLVDPSAFGPVTSSGGGDGGTGAYAAQDPQDWMVDVDMLAQKIGRKLTMEETMTLTDAVRNSGSFSIFTAVDAESTRRRDSFMFPLNTDYDLFSLGPNGRTSTSLGEQVAQDDIIRANNGGYFGSASEY